MVGRMYSAGLACWSEKKIVGAVCLLGVQNAVAGDVDVDVVAVQEEARGCFGSC